MAEWEDKTVEELEKEQDALMLDLLSQGQHGNLSFYAFTATPKPKTLQTFGIPVPDAGDGEPRYKAYHNYSMLQAIEEGFIMDVLKNYTTYQISYEIAHQSEDNPDKQPFRVLVFFRQDFQQFVFCPCRFAHTVAQL